MAVYDTALSSREREDLILQGMPQVHLIARRIHERLPGHVSMEDLVSTGVLGLISAIDNFDPSQNVKLRTYAEFRIRGAIMDSLRGLDWAPRLKRKRAKEIEAAIACAEKRLQRVPSEDEIAAELGISLDEYREWLVDVQGLDIGTLECVPSDDGPHSLLEFLPDNDQNQPSNILERVELERLLADAIDHIPQIERTVLNLYVQEELTLREIGQVLNLRPGRVGQLKSQAIVRLRSYMQQRLERPVRNGTR